MSRLPSTTPPPGAQAARRHPEAPSPGTAIPSHYEHCFGCGPRRRSGLHLRVSAGEDVSVHARFLVTGDHQGAPGLAHGGLLVAAFDEALGSLNWLLRAPAVTARLETDFLRPVPVGSALHITARCTGVSARKVYAAAEGRLDDPAGPLAVRAAALFVQVDIAHFTRHGRAEEIEAVRRDPSLHRTSQAFDVNP